MRLTAVISFALLCATLGSLCAALEIIAPLDYQVIQRSDAKIGTVEIVAKLDDAEQKAVASVETRLLPDGKWQRLPVTWNERGLRGHLQAPSGGWYRLELRVRDAGGKNLGEASVEHVGVGEIFVIAGQSNSANHGEEKQRTMTGRVVNFNGTRWALANDPQPGASGGGGSFLPPFGDAMVEKLDVPIGLVTTGIGATSVREWLPAGSRFPNPPTIESRVRKLRDGSWESKGQAYDMFVRRLRPLGPNGFRAVLWHQGESDANQRDASRTLPGKLYREYLEKLIKDSRREIGWEAPWFVAQVSYHVPGDEASPDIRAAQASLWKDGVALEGPDSDALKGEFRDGGGRGVHFSGPGLREHGKRWAEKVASWLAGGL